MEEHNVPVTQRAEELDLALVLLDENGDGDVRLEYVTISSAATLFAHLHSAIPFSHLERAIVNVGIDGGELNGHKLVRHVGSASPDLTVRSLEQKKRKDKNAA